MIIENKLYNPADLPKDWLIEHFVVRTKVFEKIFKDIKQGEMKYPEQHYLIQGQRGMGKTTLLLRLKYEVENTPELNEWLVPIFFNEESYDLTSLSNLWEKTLKYLDDIWQTGGKFYKQTDAFVGNQDYERLCFDLLTEILHNENKKLVIFFDNFGQLFLDNLSDKEQHRLREILMHSADMRIIGASAVVLEDLHDYSKPFFEFFKIINLEGLNKDETFDLIEKLQEKSTRQLDLSRNKAKIETLAILTGGVIRTVMLIYEVVLADQDGSALRDLETILDRITPLYKHRIEDLPVQQRKIVDVIAKKWDAISTKEIAENIRENGVPIATKLISAQLQQLEKNGVIEKKLTTTKNHLYQLKERFFNIWYLMRHGDRFDKCKVIWLTKFLELWYEDEEGLGFYIIKHVERLKSGAYHPNSAILIADALSRSSKIGLENQATLITETANILNDDQKSQLPDIHLQVIISAMKLFKEDKYQEAIRALERQIIQNDNYFLVLSACLLRAGRFHDAENQAKEIKDLSKKYSLIVKILVYSKEYQRAFELLISIYKKPEFNTNRASFCEELAKLYNNFYKNEDKALEFYLLSLEYGNINVLNKIVRIYTNKKDYLNAEKFCLKAIELGQLNLEKDLIYVYLFNIKDVSKAIKMIETGRKLHPDDPDYYLFESLYSIMNQEEDSTSMDQLIKALELYKEPKEVFNIYREATIRLLASYFIKNKDKVSAISVVEKLDNRYGLDLMPIYNLFIKIWNHEFSKAFELIDEVLKRIENILDDNNFEDEIQDVILLLISKKQFHYTYKLFQIEKLNFKERFKPIYYALMYLMKDEYPNEYLKMGEELKQPVQDVLKKIEQMAIDYA